MAISFIYWQPWCPTKVVSDLNAKVQVTEENCRREAGSKINHDNI
jgi:hypothetical protein